MIEGLRYFVESNTDDEEICIILHISDNKVVYMNNYKHVQHTQTDRVNVSAYTTREAKNFILGGPYAINIVDHTLQFVKVIDFSKIFKDNMLNRYSSKSNCNAEEDMMIYVFVLSKNICTTFSKSIIPKSHKCVYDFLIRDTTKEKIFKNEVLSAATIANWQNISIGLKYIYGYYAGELRKSGKPSYIRNVEVARIMIEMINYKYSYVHELLLDHQETLINAALLHDVVKYPYSCQDGLKAIFSYEVTSIVCGIANMSFEEYSKFAIKKQSFTKKDTQNTLMICVKLADRLHTIYTVDEQVSKQRRYKVASDTLKYFLQPAINLGFDYIAHDFEKAATRVLKTGKLGYFEATNPR